MPYEVVNNPMGRGYLVITKETGRAHSKRGLPKARAQAQMRALYLHAPDSDRRGRK
jgi:hypothetical protein